MRDGGGPSELIRQKLETSVDPRVARTRERLVEAVRTWAAAGEEVTVAAVVRLAGVSRATFYSHFASLDDLAAELMQDAFRGIAHLYVADPADPVQAMRHSQQRLVWYLTENRALFVEGAALPVSREGYLTGVRAMADVIVVALEEHPDRPASLNTEATARYIASAAYGLIDAWLTGEVELTLHELVDHLVALLPSWFSGIH